MNYRLLSDSSCDIHTLPGADFAAIPMHIVTEDDDYCDDADLDAVAMAHHLKQYKGKSGTACPSVQTWLDAFGEAEAIVALTLTGTLSGCYNAAVCAKEEYEAAHPGRRVHVIDSLSTGPELVLLLEKLAQLTASDLSFDEVVAEITAYQEKTKLLFLLSSVQNLARNGRVSKLQADAVGLLGIRVLGKASPEGTLAMLGKFRGEEAGLIKTILEMKHMGWEGGRVGISHCGNEAAAHKLEKALHELYPHADISLRRTGGLCSFYAEKGGLLIGFEIS